MMDFKVKLIWLIFLGPFALLAFILLIVSFTIPSIKELDNPKSNLATQVFTSDDVVLGKYFRQNRTNVEFAELSPYLVNALVATEDERFYSHSGIDAEALARAVAKLGSGGGGSTITQQLAKMQYHEPASNIIQRIGQKFGEWLIAAKIERRYSKEEIIALYFNQFDFLNNAVGVSSASLVYFGKTPKDLALHEAAMLVGMAKNPSLFNPVRRPEKVIKRREVVLKQMVKNDFITQKVYDSVRKLPLGLNYTKVDHKSGMAPYFREMLRDKLQTLLDEKKNGNYVYYNKEEDRPYDMYIDGLRVYTTIDSRMQEYAEWAVTEHLSKELQKDLDKAIDAKNGAHSKRPPFRNRIDEKVIDQTINKAKKQTMLYRKLSGKTCAICERTGTTTKKIDGKKMYVCNFDENHIEPAYNENEIDKIFNTPEKVTVFDWNSPNYEKDTVLSPLAVILYHKRFLRSSLMSIDPSTGYIRAWVGGPNFKYFQYDMVEKGKRQVGSTFKPFVYATAISEGVITPCDEVPNIEYCVDVPKGNRTDSWCPRNAGSVMDGVPVTYKFALAASMNNVTAKVIAQIKPQNVIDNVVKAGIPAEALQPYPSIALGVFDISLHDMVGAINCFANQGVYVEPVFITRIEDKKGNLIYESQSKTEQIFDPYTSYTMIQMMKGVVDGVRHPHNGKYNGTSMRLRSGRPYGGIKYPVAGKTGTTNDNTDGWFLGLTPDLVTGVWTGCEDNSISFASTNYGQGANMALPIWGYYMNKVYKDSTIKISKGDFEQPTNYIDTYNFCNGQEDGGPIDFNSFNFSGLESNGYN